MFKYLRESFRRKKARRYTREYPVYMSTFELEKEGKVEFANWSNPLFHAKTISQSEVDFYKQYVKKGDLVIDIGAHIGDTTVPVALAAGKEGYALGFDPNPYVFKILEQNAKLNKDKTNIIPVNHAISTEEESFYFISSEASFTNGGISPTKESRHGKFVYPEKIKGVNLLAYLEENFKEASSKFSFIKVDTEGYDKEILKSIADLISKYKPVIVAESFGKSSDEAKMELFDVINQHGYSIFYFEDFDINAETKDILKREEMTQWKKTINICAVPE